MFHIGFQTSCQTEIADLNYFDTIFSKYYLRHLAEPIIDHDPYFIREGIKTESIRTI